MANLKNITELPVAESAEGLNLIVNDNGAAKQIAASAVGAQADFAVTDETSPAFIKNKPAVAQADWGVEDTTNPAFIKNRPFYDTREFGTVTLTFDGDLTGKEFTQQDDDFCFVKLTGNVYSNEEFIGGILKTTTPDGVQTLEIAKEMIMINDGITVVVPDGSNGMPAFMVIPQELITGDMPFTSAGIWTMCVLADGAPMFYVSELSWNGVVSGELRTIEPKYIEDMYYTKITEDVEILPETTIEISEGSFIELQAPMVLDLVSGMDYTINWNGNSHICKANFDGEWFCLEAADVFSIWTYPYIFYNDGYYAEIEIYDDSTSVTLSIMGPSAEVKKIDAKYMPYEVQDSMNELYNRTDNAYNVANNAKTAADAAKTAADAAKTAANNAQNTANNKMTKTNPTGTGSFGMNRKAGTTIGEYSHAEGNKATASGYASHAEGYGTIASGEYSHAEGESTQATSVNCHAEGKSTKATSTGSHAEGEGTTASARASHAEGSNTIASGPYSHAEGYGTTACSNDSHTEGQHVQGKWNIINGFYAHIVGNGTSDTARSNAHTLDWDGNAWYQGTVEGAGFILASPNGTRYKITVANDGTLSAVAV